MSNLSQFSGYKVPSVRPILQDNTGFLPLSSLESLDVDITSVSSGFPTTNSMMVVKTDSYYVAYPEPNAQTIYISTDSVTWIAKTPGLASAAASCWVSKNVVILWNNNQGGNSYTQAGGYRCAISTDGGFTWSLMNQPSPFTLSGVWYASVISVTYVNGVVTLFAASTDNVNTTANVVNFKGGWKSTDLGLTWTAMTDVFCNSWANGYGVGWATVRYGAFIAHSKPVRALGQTSSVQYSTDSGATWTNKALTAGNVENTHIGLTDGTYAALIGTYASSGGAVNVAYCTIATPGTWAVTIISLAAGYSAIQGIYALGKFIVFTNYPTAPIYSATTPVGPFIAPTTNTSSIAGNIAISTLPSSAVAFNGTTVIIAYKTATSTVTVSGATVITSWSNLSTITSTFTTPVPSAAVSVGTTFMLSMFPSGAGGNEIWTSPTGVTWTAKTAVPVSGSDYVTHLTYIGTTVYAYTYLGDTWASTNVGTSWTLYATQNGIGKLLRIQVNTLSPTNLSAWDDYMTPLLSTDTGLTWTRVLATSHVSNYPHNVTSTGVSLLLSSVKDWYWYSSDGTTWTSKLKPASTVYDWARRTNMFSEPVLCTTIPVSFWSVDSSGVNWSQTLTTAPYSTKVIKYTEGCYVAVNYTAAYVSNSLTGYWSVKTTLGTSFVADGTILDYSTDLTKLTNTDGIYF